MHLWQGSLATKVTLPVILGHEMAGRSIELGQGQHRDSAGQALRIGDRITWSHTSCGSCSDYAYSREVCRDHYHSDVEASRALGTAVGSLPLNTAALKPQIEAARAELRAAHMTAE